MSVTKDCPSCDKKYKLKDSFHKHWHDVHRQALGPYKEFKKAMRKQKEAEQGNRPDGK